MPRHDPVGPILCMHAAAVHVAGAGPRLALTLRGEFTYSPPPPCLAACGGWFPTPAAPAADSTGADGGIVTITTHTLTFPSSPMPGTSAAQPHTGPIALELTAA